MTWPLKTDEVLVGKQILAVPGKTITFDLSNLIHDWDHAEKLQMLYLFTDYAGDNSGANAFISMYINGDETPANYQSQGLYGFGAISSGIDSAAPYIGAIHPNKPGSIECELEIISNRFIYETRSDLLDGITDKSILYLISGRKTVSVSSLQTLTIKTPAAGPNFSAGSVFALIQKTF